MVIAGGAAISVGCLFAHDLACSFIQSGPDWKFSSWQQYTGAAVSGAAFAETLYYTGSPAFAGAVSGAAGNATTQVLNIEFGDQKEFNYGSLAADTVTGAVGGWAGGNFAEAIGGVLPGAEFADSGLPTRALAQEEDAAISGAGASQFTLRQSQMLETGIGYNVSPESWFARYPALVELAHM